MKQIVKKQDYDPSCDPFHPDTPMNICMAKFYIDDAWEKRRIVRKAIKILRECGLEGHTLQTSYFCGVYKQAMREYRAAQKLGIAAYEKCMAEILSTGYVGYQ